jgi:hypothetical protein
MLMVRDLDRNARITGSLPIEDAFIRNLPFRVGNHFVFWHRDGAAASASTHIAVYRVGSSGLVRTSSVSIASPLLDSAGASQAHRVGAPSGLFWGGGDAAGTGAWRIAITPDGQIARESVPTAWSTGSSAASACRWLDAPDVSSDVSEPRITLCLPTAMITPLGARFGIRDLANGVLTDTRPLPGTEASRRFIAFGASIAASENGRFIVAAATRPSGFDPGGVLRVFDVGPSATPMRFTYAHFAAPYFGPGLGNVRINYSRPRQLVQFTAWSASPISVRFACTGRRLTGFVRPRFLGHVADPSALNPGPTHSIARPAGLMPRSPRAGSGTNCRMQAKDAQNRLTAWYAVR